MYRKQSKFPPVLFILCLALICFSARPTPLLSQDLIPQLIDELASRQFSTRQRAMATLIQLGPDVVPQLEEAMTNGNRELRFRAQRVLDAVDQNLYQLQLEAFMQSGENAATLPGWDGFKQLAGTTSTARRLFVLMCRAEPELMRNLERPVSITSRSITKRCKELQQVFRTYKRDSIQLGTVAALLFSGGINGVKVDETSVKTIYSVCNYNAFRNEMYTRNPNGTSQYRRTPRSNILRQLFAVWMKHGQSWDAQMAFNLAMQYDIKQCLPRAIALVRAKDTPCHVAQIALVAITRFGTLVNLRDLETRIDDKSFCGVQQRVGQKLHQTQLRDIALAGALLIADENPRNYGFTRISYTNAKQLNYSTVGFSSDEERVAPRKKYEQFRATLTLPETDTSTPAEE
ncbi:MAG: hypothetical protein ACJZ8Y_10905 [Pirellulaceae bacterium]|jgi:hypothetical protein